MPIRPRSSVSRWVPPPPGPTSTIVAALLVSLVLAVMGQPLWGLAAVLLGLAACFAAWRWRHGEGKRDSEGAKVSGHEAVDPAIAPSRRSPDVIEGESSDEDSSKIT